MEKLEIINKTFICCLLNVILIYLQEQNNEISISVKNTATFKKSM